MKKLLSVITLTLAFGTGLFASENIFNVGVGLSNQKNVDGNVVSQFFTIDGHIDTFYTDMIGMEGGISYLIPWQNLNIETMETSKYNTTVTFIDTSVALALRLINNDFMSLIIAPGAGLEFMATSSSLLVLAGPSVDLTASYKFSEALQFTFGLETDYYMYLMNVDDFSTSMSIKLLNVTPRLGVTLNM